MIMSAVAAGDRTGWCIMNRELSEIDHKEIDVQQANVDFG